MKKIPFLLILIIPLAVYSKDVEKYLYKRLTISYNPRIKQRDTFVSYFYLGLHKDKLYLSEIAASKEQLDLPTNYIGSLHCNSRQELIWKYQSTKTIIHSLSDSVNTDYNGNTKYLFLKGLVYYSGIDTEINGHLCSKFIRYFKGNPGRDLPDYKVEEYFDRKAQIFVFVRIIYQKPYKEIIVGLLNG